MARKPEGEVQHEPQVLVGEDEVPHQPEDRHYHGAEGPPDAARFTRLALWAAIAVVVVVSIFVLWAIVS